MGPGGLRGLQLRWLVALAADGGSTPPAPAGLFWGYSEDLKWMTYPAVRPFA